MIIGPIDNWRTYRHLKTGRTVKVTTAELLIKTESRDDWYTAVQYTHDDNLQVSFAVPVDVFRLKFELVKE